MSGHQIEPRTLAQACQFLAGLKRERRQVARQYRADIEELEREIERLADVEAASASTSNKRPARRRAA